MTRDEPYKYKAKYGTQEWLDERDRVIKDRQREHAQHMLTQHLENIRRIDAEEEHIKFWGCSLPSQSRAYSEKQVAYWTAQLLLGHSPHKEPDETPSR